MNNTIKQLFHDVDSFGVDTAKAVFARIYGLAENAEDDPILCGDLLADALPDKTGYYNCYQALLPLLDSIQSRFGHAEIIESVCEHYNLVEPQAENPYIMEKLRMKYDPDLKGFDGTGKGEAQDVDYNFQNQMTAFGQQLRQEVLDSASEEARERFHDLLYDPIIIADASKQTANEWQESRRIGGSSLGALMGSSPFSNAYLEYQKLVKADVLVDEKSEDTKLYDQYIMDFGHEAEHIIAQAIRALPDMAEFRDCKILVDTRIFSYEDREEYFSVNLDAILEWPDGHYSIAEFKAPGRYTKNKYEQNSIPPHYQDQMQGQMLATNIDDAYLFAFFSRDEVTVSRLVRDLDYQSEILDTIDTFWFNNVLPQIPPENIGTADMVLDANRRYNGKGNNSAPPITLDASHAQVLREADQLLVDAREFDKRGREAREKYKELVAPILVEMGESTIASLTDGNDEFRLTYKEYEDSPKLNKAGMDKLKKEEPQLFHSLTPYLNYSGGGRRAELRKIKVR